MVYYVLARRLDACLIQIGDSLMSTSETQMNKNFSRLGRTLWAGFSSALLMVGLVAILPNLATASVPGGPGSENEIRIKLWVDYNNDGTRDTAEDETFARSTITIYNADSSVYDVRSYDIFDRVNGVVFNDNGQGPWRAEIAPKMGILSPLRGQIRMA